MSVSYIYKLSFYNTKKVYIGHSLNPENRFKRHLQKLRDGIHHSKKLQLEYIDNQLGDAELDILEECHSSEAIIREKYWIDKYNSYLEGYNSSPGGEGIGFGEYCPASKHKLDDYKAILAFLAYTDMTTREIAQELNIGTGIVLNISSQTNHLYLKDLMPEAWSIMVSKSRHHPNWKMYPNKIKSPDGTYFTVENATKFGKEHGLDPSDLRRVLNGKKKQIKGWTLSA